MYNQKLVASIKAKGQILREFKDTVYLPWGTEYSILLKNLNTVRALVHVYIDGELHTPSGLILNAGQECDLERSIKNNNLTEGNRFKFVERTSAVEQHRGIKAEDGLVRIEFQFELPQWQKEKYNDYNVIPSPWNSINNCWEEPLSDIYRTTHNYGGGTSTSASTNRVLRSTEYFSNSMQVNDAGITVPGSYSSQTFTAGNYFPTESQRHNIVLRLLGEQNNQTVSQPVTVKHRQQCPTCGHKNKATARFCSKCGTALEIYG